MALAHCSRTLPPAALAAPRLGSTSGARGSTRLLFAPLSSRAVVRASVQDDAKPISKEESQASLASTLAASVFSALAAAPAASSAELVAQLAADDNRGLVLLGVLVPALGWVLFNILKPALNQLDKMQGKKAFRAGVAGLGVSAAVAAGAMIAPENADAAGLIAQVADADNRLFFILFPVVPALGWVLFNILKPALNQISKMQGKPPPSFTLKKPATKGTTKKAASLVGAAGLMAMAADSADAAQEVATLAADNRPLVLLFVLVPALGWVLFNILKPALNQIGKMQGKK